MRKTAFASSALSVMTLVLGLLFMLHQIPYSNYILALSLFLLAVSLIIFYTLNKQIMYVVGAIFCFLPMAGMMFRQLSLPGAEFIITSGLFLFAILFIPWYAYSSYKRSIR
ncbi:MAG: hypothetical protein V3V53_08920 [Bacteroidales bacterium]